MKKYLIFAIAFLSFHKASAQNIPTKMVVVDTNGWAKNSVNVTVFRKNSLAAIVIK